MIAQMSVLASGAGAAASQVSASETVMFWILGPITLIGALGMLFSRNAVHSALWLALTMLALGALYLVCQAPFLGFVQVIVYTGAIMMLFLFVLMMVGRDNSDSVVEVLRGQRLWAGVLGIGLVGLVVGGVSRALLEVTSAGLTKTNDVSGGNPGNVGNIGRLLFTDYLFPFELTSALLITAAVGAMVLAHIDRRRLRRTQRELVQARFRGEHDRPSPLPGPGVFATHDSVSTPALLPDGSVAPESLSTLIDAAHVEDFMAERAEITGKSIGPALSTVDAHALAGGDARGAEHAGHAEEEKR